jgi:hypothetical protein
LGIKEKREEGCMERNVQIGNKWWKLMTKYSKEMKTRRRGVEDTIKKKHGRMYAHWRGFQLENRRKRSKKVGRGEEGWEKKIQKQGGKCRGEETDGIDGRKWMGNIE